MNVESCFLDFQPLVCKYISTMEALDKYNNMLLSYIAGTSTLAVRALGK